MELVYLWVEDYKNIKKQGFNFSPQFNCKFHDEYDENGKLKDNCKLEIKENDDYIENFFGENINVTAIVGKNGSGKSSILELIIESLYEFSNPLFKIQPMILIFHDEISNELSYISNYKKDIKATRLYKGIKKDINLFILHYDYSLSQFRPFKKNRSFSSWNSYNSFLSVSTSLYKDNSKSIQCVPKKIGEDFSENIFMNSDYDKIIIVKYIVKKSVIEENNPYFEPVLVEISDLVGIHKDFTRFKKLRLKSESLEYLETTVYLYILNLLSSKLKGTERILLQIKELNTFDELKQYLNDDSKEFMKNVNTWIEKSDNMDDYWHIKNILEYAKLLEKYQKENDDFFYKLQSNYKTTPPPSPTLGINTEKFNKKNIEILTELPLYCFQMKIYNNNREKEYDDLSNGEKSALRIRFYIEDILHRKKQDNFLILLDEPVNDMHPDWQKKLLNYLVNTFKNREQNFHFIFTTHSPFIISDLPRENIIFLDNGKQAKGIEKKQTFGANIHTLLSDSFFMKDGLMGEFAKGKINEIKEFYEKVAKEKKTDENIDFYNKHQEKFWQIQKIIGEPFLQKIVKNQLEEIELILLGRDEAIDNEIARLQALKVSSKNA